MREKNKKPRHSEHDEASPISSANASAQSASLSRPSFLSAFISLYPCQKFFLFLPLLCVAFFVGHGIYSAHINSVTADEYVHLPTAISILQTGDLIMDHAGSPPLRALAAFPALLANPVMDYDNSYWRNKKVYQFSWMFLKNNFANYHEFYFLSRMSNIAVALLLLALIYLAALHVFGKSAAVFAVFLFCFNPEMLAHAPLMTVDVPVACFFLPPFISSRVSSPPPARLMYCSPGFARDLRCWRSSPA